jgi:hypothetical protein
MDAWRYEFIFLSLCSLVGYQAWTLENKFHISALPCIIFLCNTPSEWIFKTIVWLLLCFGSFVLFVLFNLRRCYDQCRLARLRDRLMLNPRLTYSRILAHLVKITLLKITRKITLLLPIFVGSSWFLLAARKALFVKSKRS